VLGEIASVLESVFVIDCDDFIDDPSVEVLRYKAGTDALDTMLAWLPTADHGRVLGLDGDGHWAAKTGLLQLSRIRRLRRS